jgi:phospholipid/cholesterol/gamma-HCH transport system substrate-binding protein
MVGAITTLIIVVAVFLAYNANQGLPFVPVYRVSAQLPDAARAVPNNEVRIGGTRVGVVESIETTRNQENNTAAAKLNLKLDKSAQPIPKDSTVRIRYRSNFGLKYIELEKGKGKPLPEGGTLSIKQAVPQTEFDEINNTFNEETRENGRVNLEGFGNAFAGRGAALNQAIENLNPLFRHLRPVMRNLAAPRTRLVRFFPELADASRIVAPVASTQAELFTNMAITFAAFSADTEALKATISKSPPTLDVSIRSLRVQRPFLEDFADLSRRLRPGVAELPRTLPVLNRALVVGTPVLRRTVPTNRELGRVFDELDQLVSQPATKVTLKRLQRTFDQAYPLIRHVGPYQTVCNYWNYWFTYLPEHITQRDQVGYEQRVNLITMPEEAQARPNGYAAIQASGKDAITGEFKPHENPILHGNPYGPAIDKNGRADCQGGQVGYPLGEDLVPGQSPSNPTYGVPDIPGSRGPTYHGRARKP